MAEGFRDRVGEEAIERFCREREMELGGIRRVIYILTAGNKSSGGK